MSGRFESLCRLLESRSPIDIDGTPHGVWLIDFRDPSPAHAHSVDERASPGTHPPTDTTRCRDVDPHRCRWGLSGRTRMDSAQTDRP